MGGARLPCLTDWLHVCCADHAPASFAPRTPHAPSRLALTTKITLDQVVGFAIWHAALCAIHEPHRRYFTELAAGVGQQLGDASAPASTAASKQKKKA